jgi:beta-lactamase superfamily II metal-dependent hydrolase
MLKELKVMDIVIFNVELGQCVFFYPRNNSEYAMMVDCGNTPEFEPVDFLTSKDLLDNNTLYNLTITNYDQDHFSGLPYLRSKVLIKTVSLSKNLTSRDIKLIKDDITEPIAAIIDLLNTYTSPVTDYNQPFKKTSFYLNKSDFPDENIDTNKLSQLVFVEYYGTTICIAGDLTAIAWDKILKKQGVTDLLKKTNIFLAPHHGRENGFNKNIFRYCYPEVIIMSDKKIIHSTQEGQTKLYEQQICGNGIIFDGSLRKVLTTRSDGHIWIRIENDGARTYKKLSI